MDPNAPPFRREFLSPRYWPTWMGIAVLRALAFLPVPWLITLGEGLGWLIGRVMRGRRHIVRVNLRLCFPDKGERELERLTDEHFKALGAGLFEATLAWWASDERLLRHGEVVGLEHLDAAMAGGTGALLLTGHFTTLELGARYVAMQRPFHAMYRPIKNRLIDYFMHHWRGSRAGLPALARDDLRRLVKSLREGRAVWDAPDQTLDRRYSVFAPFFGVPTLTITATAKLAQLGRARVVPFFPERVNGRYRVTFLPALEDFPGPDEAADAARINRVLEDGVRRALPQYWWVHKRFKWRPPGEPSPYARPGSGAPPRP